MQTRRGFLGLMFKAAVVAGVGACVPGQVMFAGQREEDSSHTEEIPMTVTMSFDDYDYHELQEPELPQHEHHMIHEWEMPSHR